MNKHQRTLELDRVLEMLAEQATCAASKELALRLEPCDNYRDAADALQRTADINTLTARYGTPGLGGIQDCTGALQRAKLGSRLSAGEILQVARVLRTIRTIKKWRGQGETPTAADDLFHVLAPVEGLEKDIFDAILSEEEIADTASPALNDLRRRIRRAQLKVREQLDGIIRSPQYAKALQEPIITMRDGRFVVPVKIECKNEVKGLVHDTSSSGATVFIEPMAVVDANNEIRMLQNEEQLEIDRILQELSERIGQVADATRDSFAALLQLDLLFAKSRLADKMKATVPELNEEGIIEFRKARHPLINKEKVVPVDIRLGDGFDTLVITGPNTGGKTVSLKTVGLLTLMGQSGLHIPALDRSSLSVFDEVYADIGDEQSIEQSLSTFSSHMTNVVSFLDKADRNSLVLFDELGAGTDPTEGAALAIAILSTLHERGIRTMATTHYSELKIYALSTPGVENACCEFDVETLSPTYRLLVGVPGKSNAFAISSKLGLPDYIINKAKDEISEQDESFEDVLTTLEQNRITLEREKEELARTRAEVESLKQSLAKNQEQIDARKEKMISNATEEAQRILREAKEYADQTMRDFQKFGKENVSVREMEQKRTALREKMNKLDKKKAKEVPKRTGNLRPQDLHLGDAVKVLSMNLKGTVSTRPDSKGNLFVQMGIMRTKVHISDLVLIDEAVITGPSISRTSSGKSKLSKAATISTEINLLGKTVDEAVAELDKYLDDAYLSHLPSVRVVHGKGTGALRKGIHNYLRRQKHVADFHLAEFGEGDAGVTIVTFKK